MKNYLQMGDVLGELHKAREVFIEKATEQARHMAWVIAVIYSKVKYLLAIGFSTRYGRLKNSNLALCLKTKHSVDKIHVLSLPLPIFDKTNESENFKIMQQGI